MPPEPRPPIVIMLATEGELTNLIFHEVNKILPIHRVIFDAPYPKKKLLKGRIRRQGWWPVIGQVLFMALINPWLKFRSKQRIKELIAEGKWNIQPIANELTEYVPSINHKQTYELLAAIKPDLILVNGTRIISQKVIDAATVPLINLHVGITPKYRGVHGGYWALAQGDRQHCGVTVHMIDPGIDTGTILRQGNIDPGPQDNFATYPYLQMIKGVGLLKMVLRDWLNKGELNASPEPGLESRLWYHPTFWGYLSTYWKKGVK